MDTERQAIVVRTRDIWLPDAEDKKEDLRSNEGYEEYVFPLSESAEHLSPNSNEITKLLSIYQDHREETLYEYKTIGLVTIPINMERVQDLIVMFDEPETHMHPEAGRHFIKTLESSLTHFQSAGLFKACQIILATHSPFLIQSLSSYPVSIALTENSHGQITIRDFNDLESLHLPGREKYSFNLVMYHIFHVPTTELHDELYGYLQEVTKCYSAESLDEWFLHNSTIEKTKSWIAVIKGNVRDSICVSLQRYIRNSIHHPENTKNPEYTPEELCQSTEEMLKCLR